MKVLSKYKIEKCASTDETRPNLCAVWLDLEKADAPLLVATDGHVLAAVPVEVDAGEKPGYVSTAALKAARILAGRSEQIDVLAEPPDERTFPAWRRVVPQSHRGQPGTLTFCFDSKLLTRIVAALGGDGRVELTVLLDAKRPGFSDGSPIEVRTVNGDPCEIGALMPSCS